MNLVHIDELDAIELPDGFVWRPVRRHFGIRAFGTNVYTPGASGQVIEEHIERLGQEEIYLVLRGRVRFTLGDDEHELGQGQLVHVSDPSLKRGAVKLTDEGRRVLRVAEPLSRRVDERILEALPNRQREQFIDELQAIVETLQKLSPQD